MTTRPHGLDGLSRGLFEHAQQLGFQLQTRVDGQLVPHVGVLLLDADAGLAFDTFYGGMAIGAVFGRIAGREAAKVALG